MSNGPYSHYKYEVHVYTGFKKKSETDSKIFFVLSGTKGDTGVRRLDDGVRNVSYPHCDSRIIIKTPLRRRQRK